MSGLVKILRKLRKYLWRTTNKIDSEEMIKIEHVPLYYAVKEERTLYSWGTIETKLMTRAEYEKLFKEKLSK